MAHREDSFAPPNTIFLNLAERGREGARERDVGIICVKIYDDLALEAWTQRIDRERERKR